MKKIRTFTLAGAAHSIIVDDYRLNLTCHCEGAAHDIILDDYRFNAPCHCEECHGHDEAISLNKVDSMPRDCHAAPSAPLAMTCGEKRKAAFTLAETLITLMVIGVVAALTIPSLMQQINNETLKGQRITTGSKLAKGFAQMRADGVLEEKYASTAEFVEKMKQYFQISQVCDSNNLTKCFVSTVITQKTENNTTVNEENNIDEVKDKDKILGIRFSDGTGMLIKYNPESELAGQSWSDEIIDKGRIGKLSNKDSYPTYSDLFYYVIDVNNSKSPNTKGKDIVGNLVLEKGASGTDFGLGFVFIDDTAFSHGCGYEDLDCVIDFCKEKGGRVPTHDDIMTIANKLFDMSGDYYYYLKENYDPNLLRVFASSSEGEIVQSTSIGPYNEYCAYFGNLADCKPGEGCGFDPNSCGAFPGYVGANTFCIK